MFRLFYIIFLGLIISCTGSEPPKTVLFTYDDFGPPAVANEIIGMDWWQWQTIGDSRPKKYDIKVVVYKDIDIDEVKQKFPVNPSLQQDYRYVEYTIAINYLNKIIEENVIESLTTQLISTNKKLLESFKN